MCMYFLFGLVSSSSLAHTPKQRAYPEQGGPPPRPINHAIIEHNNTDHRVPPPMFVFPPYSMCLSEQTKNPNLFLPLPQVQNAPGTSHPAVESSSRPAFQRSTPTTWTAHSWSLLLRCLRSFWSSRASNWSRTHSLPLECPAATTAWRFGTVSLEVSR